MHSLSRPLRIFLFLVTLLGAVSCGVPAPGGNGGRTEDLGGEGLFVDITAVCLTIQATPAMVATTQDRIFNWITPNSAYAFDSSAGLDTITTLRNSISVVALDENMNETLEFRVPAFRIADSTNETKQCADYELQFNQSSYQPNINVVIKVELAGSDFVYAPAVRRTSDDEIVINVGSHYLITKLFDAITSRSQLEESLQCTTADGCENQPEIKNRMLFDLNTMIQEYDLLFSPTQEVSQALSVIDNDLNLRTSVERAVSEIIGTQSPFAEGTARSIDLVSCDDENNNDQCDPGETSLADLATRITDYNSHFFGLSFNKVVNIAGQGNDGDVIDNLGDVREIDDSCSNCDISFSAIWSDIAEVSETTATALPSYPRSVIKTQLFNFRIEEHSLDLFFRRANYLQTFSQEDGISGTLSFSDPVNSLAFFTEDAYLTVDGNVLAESVFEQYIPISASNTTQIGWDFDPTFTQLYRVRAGGEISDPGQLGTGGNSSNESFFAPPWVVSSRVIDGTAYNITSDSTRLSVSEIFKLFAWEVHGEITDTTFGRERLDDKTYANVSFSVQFDQPNEYYRVFLEFLRWDINGATVFETQPASDSDLYQTYEMARLIDGDTTNTEEFEPFVELISNSRRDAIPSRTITEQATSVENSNTGGTTVIQDQDQGLLRLDGSTESLGSSTNNGEGLVFNIDREQGSLDARGKGLLVGAELRTASANYDEDTFFIQGNSITLDDNNTTLNNYNDSRLIIDSQGGACTATLTLVTTSVSHQQGVNDISTPSRNAQTIEQASDSCVSEGEKVLISFNSIAGEPLELKGIASKSGSDLTGEDSAVPDLITFGLISGDNTLGMLFATRSQTLPTSFED